jgi:hypothetical protein
VVVGAPKCGTTSLFYYLRQHPDVYLPIVKELHYFSFPDLGYNSNGPGDKLVQNQLCQTWEQYIENYMGVSGQQAIGDISPSYLYYSQSAERIRDKLGMAKIIIILRNPVDKAYSQYMHMVREGLEMLSFPGAIEAEEERCKKRWGDIWRYTESSLYANHVERFQNIFGKNKVKVILFDDLVNDARQITTSLFDYIGVDSSVEVSTGKKFNKTGKQRFPMVGNFMRNPGRLKRIVKRVIPDDMRFYIRDLIVGFNTGSKPEIPSDTRRMLYKKFHNDVMKLEQLIDRKTGWIERE